MHALVRPTLDTRQANGLREFLLPWWERDRDSVTLPSVDLAAYCATSGII